MQRPWLHNVLVLALTTFITGSALLSPHLATACPGHKAAKEADQKSRLAWRSDLDNALVEARESGKPVLVFFGTDACGACDKMVNTTLKDERVQDSLKGFVTVHIDVTNAEQDKLAKQLGVGSVPSLIFFNSKGERLDAITIDTFISADKLLPMVEKVG